MATGTADPRKDFRAPTRLTRLLERRRRCEQPHECVGQHQRAGADFGIRCGIGPGGKRVGPDRALHRDGRIRDADLDLKRAVVELTKRRHERLASEPSEPAVEEPIRPAGNTIVIGVVGVGVGQNHGVRDGVEQPEPEDVRSTALGDDRGGRRPRLAVDGECGVECGRQAVLEHRPAFVGEQVTHRTGALRMEYGCMVLDLIAVRTGDGIFVTLATATGIEQWTETDLGREGAVEDGATAVELRPLGAGEPGQRVARLGRPAARRGAAHGDESDPATLHGTPASILPMRSMVYATKPVGRLPNETRITSPGFSAARLIGALCAPFWSVIGTAAGTCRRTTRSARPTPVVTSSVRARVSTARIAPRTLSCGAVGCCAASITGTTSDARDSKVTRCMAPPGKASEEYPYWVTGCRITPMKRIVPDKFSRSAKMNGRSIMICGGPLVVQ